MKSNLLMFLLVSCMPICCLTISCSSETKEKENNLNRAKIGDIYAEFLTDDSVSSEGNEVLKKIVFTNKSGERIDYGDPHAYGALSRNIVSPDGKWVFLTWSVSGDFMFCKSEDLWDCLKQTDKFTHVSVVNPNEQVYHRFVGWKGDSSVEVELTAGGEIDRWVVDLRRRKCISDNKAMFQLKVSKK